jgi:G2F domain
MRPRAAFARGVSIAAVCFFLQTSTAAAQVMYMVGNISGTVNGTAVDFDLHIKLNMKTGEETARVGNMDPEMGAILRQVTAMVTIGGPTGGATPRGGQNLFKLSGGNFVNQATVYWPRMGDRLELIHNVSYSGGNTMKVSATMNGTVPIIEAHQRVVFDDFTEIMYWDSPRSHRGAKAAQAVTTGVGFRGDFSRAQFRKYHVGGVEKLAELEEPCDPNADPACEDDEQAKGSTTTYTGVKPFGAVLRAARDITTTYDPVKRTMIVHLYNTLTPVEAPGSK